MRVINTEAGQVLQLFVTDEIWPLSGLYIPALLDGIAERYEFVSEPEDLHADLSKGVKFRGGHISVDAREIMVSEIHLYNDGVLITTPTTTDADIVTDDFLQWATRAFKLRERRTMMQRRYVSSIVVEFDDGLDDAIRSFEKISASLAQAFTEAYKLPAKFNLQRLAFAADPQTMPSLVNTTFLLERRANISYSANRYHSTAPLTTDAHLLVLEKLEESLRGNSGKQSASRSRQN
jgi:hypothetical protein